MDRADLINRFTFHPASPEQATKYENIRATALQFALAIEQGCPSGREKVLAITHLEEVVFWANASVARSGEPQQTGSSTEVPNAHVGVPLGRDNVTDVQLSGHAAGDALVEDLPPPPHDQGLGS